MATELLIEKVRVVEFFESVGQGLPGPAASLTTTKPIPIQLGRIALPTAPMGGVVWNMALVYVDLTPADFDAAGALLANRNYLVEDHLVRVAGSSVVFTNPPPADGLHAVVSYLAAVP